MNKYEDKQKELTTNLKSRKKNFLSFCFFVSLFLALISATHYPHSQSKIYIKKDKNKNYQLFVQNRPYIIKGVIYNPIPIGQGQDYDWWSDPNKPWLVDGKLMKEMGINTVRFYQVSDNVEAVKQVIRDLYQLYGIRSILGHWLGFWEYPRYGDKDFQDKVRQEVLNMVNLYKDEEGVLFWVLGNENNYSFSGQVNPWSTDEIDQESGPIKRREMRARIYYSFVNDLAREIHKADPNRPVASGNGELIGLEVANKVCPDIDLVACIIYRGKTFGNLFNSLKATFDRPMILSEFGGDSYDAYRKREDQNIQAFFLESQWKELFKNIYPNKEGAGNCLGGTMFEWTDGWWKHNEHDPDSWVIHDTESNWTNSSYYFDIKAGDNKNMNEEWFGIVAISPEIEEGINKRIPRKVFYIVKELWKEFKVVEMVAGEKLSPGNLATSEEVEAIINEALGKLSRGKLLIDIPQEMLILKEEIVGVRITKKITEDFRKGLTEKGIPQEEEIDVGKYMKACLTGYEDKFDIKELSEETQAIESTRFTQWQWLIKPWQTGIQTLLLSISITTRDGSKTFPVFRRQIRVRVGGLCGIIRCILVFLKRHWQWLIGIVITAIGLVVVNKKGKARKNLKRKTKQTC